MDDYTPMAMAIAIFDYGDDGKDGDASADEANLREERGTR